MSEAPRLALYTFGVFRKPAADPANAGFHARDPVAMDAVALSAGFIARSGYGDPGDGPEWGETAHPPFYVERGDGWTPQTLSLWVDVEAALAFAYHGIHAEALRRARDWFDDDPWPGYAAWWVGPEDTPVWADGVAALMRLHQLGPTAEGFDFKAPFDAAGAPLTPDAKRLTALIAENQRAVDRAGLAAPA